MILSSTILVAELQYYSELFLKSLTLNKNNLKIPASFSSIYTTPTSFIQLLFDENWPTLYTSYKYLYTMVTSKSSWPQVFRDRTLIYPESAQYYILSPDDQTSSTNINIFNLRSDDFLLLDKLLEYRLDSTSVVLTDIDSTALTTNLSIMIYKYLDLKLNDRYQSYNNTTLISDSTRPLEVLYEAYLVENFFIFMTSKGT
jgi:hypothetical protein